MNEAKQLFEKNLIKENNAAVNRLFGLHGSQCCSISNAVLLFERLVCKIQGLPVDREWLLLDTTLSYNHCYLMLVAPHFMPSVHVNDTRKTISHSKCGRLSSTVEDSLKALIFRVFRLKHDDIALTTANQAETPLSNPILNLLLASWFPGSAKAAMLQIAVTYCWWLLEDRQSNEALRMSVQLLQRIIPKVTDLIQMDSLNLRLLLPRVHTEVCEVDVSCVADAVRFMAAIASFQLMEWNAAMMHLNEVVTYPLKLYASYAKAYILYERKLFDDALVCLNDLIERNDLSQELMLNIRNLIGCSLSRQGHHRSAIQVFKKCLLEDQRQSSLPLYNIIIQYRKLLLVDAELEMLKMLAKFLECCENSSDVSDLSDVRLSFDSEVNLNVAPVDRSQVLYTCAKRCLDLQRYDQAVETFLEFFSCRSLSPSSALNVWHQVVGCSLPSLEAIYSQAIHASICAKRYEHGVHFCDIFLDKCDMHLATVPVPVPANNQLGSSTGQHKRLREADESVSVGVTSIQRGTITWTEPAVLLYKSECHLCLGQTTGALLYIDRAITVIESALSPAKTYATEVLPCSKRIKMDTESADEERQVLLQMLSNAYSLKSLVLIALDRLRDALHWSRLAYQLCIDETEKVYNLALLLCKMQRDVEAASLWLSHRGLRSASHDTLQLDLNFRQCCAAADKMDAADAVTTQGSWCKMDVEALRIQKMAKWKK